MSQTHSARFLRLAADAKTRIMDVTPAEAVSQQNEGALLLDVREEQKFGQEHIADAVHLSRGVLEQWIEEVAPDVATLIICYCGGGNRSALAADTLQQMGYTNA